MRGLGRARPQEEEEEESVFISMADMTISFLFVIMILLAFFASQFSLDDPASPERKEEFKQERDRFLEELQVVQQIVGASDLDVADDVRAIKEELDRLRRQIDVPDQLNRMEVYNAAVAEARKELLTNLKREIDSQIRDVNVQISANFDALQFSGDGLFETGAEVPTAAGVARVKQLAQILDRNLGCFSLGPRKAFQTGCNPSYALIEALQVEGHTDNRGSDNLNMGLSANRASSVYQLMTQEKPDLVGFANRSAQPVLSVAGFGEGRPIQSNDSALGQDANRRIDLRFIMVVPSREAEIGAIKDALTELAK
jgi:flagellar motor protein MotB